ncbi:acylglycerol kinase, mitochondrial [Anthonomus grandis grandis]|uniref:acylglycerol kinase, mitochondrial n=1 Tax=Anthonomus grandis grandis TaxID=2921223 RepID=UPI002165C9E6|nr:acylglycerol kinase, mitochondrial [Anthonomus grandis grandis]
MAFVIKTAKTLRNNWKKSTFFAVVLTWGGSYTKNHFETQSLMRQYSEKAAEYGHQTIPVTVKPRNITVVLNPNANKRKAQAEFDKYCAPLLHLAGISLDIVKTESEGHAKELVENLNGAEAIVVAGGDGTLSDVVTGLLRRTNKNASSLVPVGVLPLGKNNTVSQTLFPGSSKLEKVKSLADATMAVIEEVTKPIDVMKIEILNEESKKPVYAVAGIKWGAYRDAEVKKESYWYFGGFKKYATYLFNGLKSSLSWNCEAQLLYSPPCDGCSNCYKVQNTQPKSRWFQNFIKENDDNIKYQRIHNPSCNEQLEKKISTSDLMLFTSNVIPSRIQDSETPKLNLFIGPDSVDYLEFVKQGWKSEKGENREVKESIEARTIEINPEKKTDKVLWFSIDNEDYEVKPIRVTLLPKILKIYVKSENV